MGKREIVAAAKRKGIVFDDLVWSMQTTPGGTVGCWEVYIGLDMELAISEADPDFGEWNPDCGNAADVMAWIARLPNLNAIGANP